MKRHWRRSILFLILLSLPVIACSYLTDLSTTTATPTTQPAPELPAVEVDPSEPPAPPSNPDLEVAEAVPVEDVSPAGIDKENGVPPRVAAPAPEWPAPLAPFVPFARSEVSEDEEEVSARLADAALPQRDDLELARIYEGWDGVIPEVPTVEEALPVGSIEQLNVLNHEAITINPITAELQAVSDHAYFWFDTGPGSVRPSQGDLVQASQAFDQIYEQSVALFGPENNPGIDGDPRVHIVNASPGALCNSTQQCGVAGYFSSFDGLPVTVDPGSNAREMFVMNVDYFGSDFYINVLTHELRHMIEENYDNGDADWEVEGAAMLAEDLLGYNDNAIFRANLFMDQPDQQLNNWTDGDTTPHYGQGYLLNRYIYDRLGQDLYAQFAASEEYGLQAINTIAQANNLDLSGEELWLDWLVAMAIHDHRQAPEEFQFGVSGLDTASMTEVDGVPVTFGETVQQYAVDYYYLDGHDELTLDFHGSALVPLVDTMPASGQWMWIANRANYSHASMSRPVDLSAVEKATLEYQVYHDIEASYDFAYLFVSVDGGETWQPLVADNMAGPEDDPSESALAERFYTGQSERWLAEQVDLTPYVGQEILIRFAYLTDPILTKGGIAIDNIAIPEIGYYDDVETTGDGWTGQGFERVTATVPQNWHLQLITFPDGNPQVESLMLSSESMLSKQVDLVSGEGEAILIVAASAPMTLEPASYSLEFDR